MAGSEQFDTIIIGGGQAGLATAYHLAQRAQSFVVLDAYPRVGDSWRQRYDSLRLFSPARFNGLPGSRFPAPRSYFPTGPEMADYLETYAEQFGERVRSGVRVTGLSKTGARYVVTSDDGPFEARHVVIATGAYQRPRIPALAARLDPALRQIHSFDYRNPGQLAPGGVLVVGAGNSGADLALETAPDHPTWLAGRRVGQVPFDIEGVVGRTVLAPILLRVIFHRILTTSTPMGGRLARPLSPRAVRWCV